ncbi:MAG: hypothetical protein GY780_09140 [bacterium]|nr:hypothetical protein [bacterium]
MKRWIKPANLPLVVAWSVIIGLMVWVGFNPQVMAPHLAGLVGKHLLGIEEGGLSVQDFEIRIFEGMDLYGVSLTLPSQSGGITLIAADTVKVDFYLQEVLDVVPLVRRVDVRNPEVFSRAGADSIDSNDPVVFPRLEIEHLNITSAYLEFSKADGKLIEKISRMDFKGSARFDEGVEMALHGVDVVWDSHRSVLEDLRGVMVVDAHQVSAMPVYGLLNGNPVRASGSRLWDETLDIEVQAMNVSVAEVEDLIDMTIGFKAAGNLNATFVSADDGIVYEGLFNGELEGYELRDLHGRAVIAGNEVRITNMDGTINEATFVGTGHFDISSKESVKFLLEGDVANVDMAKGLIPGEEDLPVTKGHGRLRIEHTDMPMWTRVSGVLNDGQIEIVPFDTCYVDVVAHENSLDFNQVELFYNDLHALLEGRTDTLEVFTGQLSFGSENISTLPEQWQWPTVQGRLYGRGDVNGPLDNLNFNGWLGIYDFQLSELKARYAEIDLIVDDALGKPKIETGIEGKGLAIGGVPLGNYFARGSVSEVGARVDSFSSELGDTNVALAFNSSFSDTLQHFNVSQFAVDLEGTHWSLDEGIEFSLGPGFFQLPGLEFSSDQGRVQCRGYFKDGEEVSGDLKLEDFDLGLINPFVQTEAPLVGRLTADTKAEGPSDDPIIAFDGQLLDADFALSRVDTLDVDATLQGGFLNFKKFTLASEYGHLDLVGSVEHPGAGIADFWPGAELDIDLTIHDGNWLFLEQFQIPALDRIEGEFSGELYVGGSTDDPEMVGRMRSGPFHIHWLHFDEISAEVWGDATELVLADLKGHKDSFALTGRIEIPMDLNFYSEPVAPLDGPFYMQMDIPPGTDLEPLSRATNGFIQSSGTGSASVVVSGPLDHPFYQGHVLIEDAGFVLPKQEEIYSHTSIKGTFSGDQLILEDIQGREGLKGEFSGQGNVKFRGLFLESFNVLLDLDRFLVASIPDIRAVVSGRNCHLSSEFVGPDSLLVPKFSGNLEVKKARFTGDFKEKKDAVDPLLPTVAPDWLSDLKLHADPRTVRILNREMELFLGGDMDLVRHESGLYLRGTLDVNSGRLVVFNNSFNVKRGRLDFSNELGFDPRMDVDAETRYRLRSEYSSNSVIEHIGVHVTGTITKPEITFSSERGYSREAIQRMLMGLEPEATPEGDGTRLANTSISAGFNVLEREIARELDVFDTFEIDQIQRERDTGESGLDPLIGVGKYIGSDLYLKYAQGIRQDDRDFMVEYQINDHLLLQSEVRRRIDENQGQPTYNLDLKYRFEY